MDFCSNCGAKLKEGEKFCSNCGQQILKLNSRGEREKEYAGKIIKCPACGATIPSFTGICPSCGHEINDLVDSDSIKLFITKIDKCDINIANSFDVPKKGWTSWSSGKKFLWVILNVFTICIPLFIYLLKSLLEINKEPTLTIEEKLKVNVIENYLFNYDRSSLLEALMFIKSKTAFLAAEIINASNVYWANLWGNKAKQLYQKSETLFGCDEIANKTYNDIQNNVMEIRKKVRMRFVINLIIMIVIFFVFICI